ncbi:MAG: hypothetical protein WBA76_20600 [Phormidesmis sp.]
MLENLKTYDRQPSDTERSWQAFGDYLLLNKPRTLKSLHGHYGGGTGTQNPPTKSLKTLRNWCDRYKWRDRAVAFDADQGALKIQERARAQRQEEIAEIERYSRIHRDSGVAGMQLVMKLKNEMTKFLSNQKSFLIDDLNGLTKVARIATTLEPPSSESWAKAAGINEIMGAWMEHQKTED